MPQYSKDVLMRILCAPEEEGGYDCDPDMAKKAIDKYWDSFTSPEDMDSDPDVAADTIYDTEEFWRE